MATKSVRMLRNYGRFKAGSIYTAVPEWCRQLVWIGYAEELRDDAPPPAAESAKPRRRGRPKAANA